ncbi:hypothetical protein ACFLSJ_07575, partial [Verrucomicrobiota bacterium]
RSQAGWHMHATPGQDDGQQPGVYSTAFAVQLLCGAAAPEEHALRTQIVAGMRYLTGQWRDSEAVLGGTRSRCKQYDKKQEVGHTDFQLTLKCVAVMDAANAIADIRTRHEEFGRVLDESKGDLDGVAGRIKENVVEWQDEGVAYIGWPWHFIEAPEQWDIIPTAKVAMALTHPGLRSTPRHLARCREVINSLEQFAASDATVVHKAVASRALFVLEARMGSGTTEAPRALPADVDRAAVRQDEYPWQEALHYTVPYRSHNVSHHKPWLWLCSRIEIAGAAVMLDPGRGLRLAATTAAEMLTNVHRNNGTVQFLSTQPPTLLAALETQRLLMACQAAASRSPRRRALFMWARASSMLRGGLQRCWWLPYSAIAALLIVQHGGGA